MPLIGKLNTDHEMGNAKRERKNNKVHAIGASRQITAFPLLGLVGKEKNSDFAGEPREHDFIPEYFWVSYVYIGAWGAYLGLQNGWYNTEIKSRKSDMHPLLTA